VAAARTSTLPATHTGNRAHDVQEPFFVDVNPRRRRYRAATASSAPAAGRRASIMSGKVGDFFFPQFFPHHQIREDAALWLHDAACIHNVFRSRASVLLDLRISWTFACPPGERPPLNLSKSAASAHAFRHIMQVVRRSDRFHREARGILRASVADARNRRILDGSPAIGEYICKRVQAIAAEAIAAKGSFAMSIGPHAPTALALCIS